MKTNITIQTQPNADKPRLISRHIYGHFAEHLGRCIYEGMWVGEDSSITNTAGLRNDVVEALRRIRVPVLRWPGGCFADEYHWKDGIGPRNQRKRMVNTHWGGVVENNHFGTHEFLQLCELIGCEPYICGNVGSGTVLEMQEWIEYMSMDGESPMANWRRANGREEPWKITYFGVGNESWGCGGNMRPEYYADEYRRYQTYVRKYGETRAYRIACGAHDANVGWTDVLMREAGRYMDGLSLHYYTLPYDWQHRGTATDFTEVVWFETLRKAGLMDSMIRQHAEVMDRYDPEQRVGMIVDEWGTWYDVEPGTNPGFLYQQNTLRDALVAGIHLNIFNSHCDRVHMANLAQTINVLQALILTDGPRMLLTPTYHVFDLFKVHQDARLLPTSLENVAEYKVGDGSLPQLSVSASQNSAGKIHVSLCNLDHTTSADVALNLGSTHPTSVTGQVITAPDMHAHNTFDAPDTLVPEELKGITVNGQTVSVNLPPMSVAVVAIG